MCQTVSILKLCRYLTVLSNTPSPTLLQNNKQANSYCLRRGGHSHCFFLSSFFFLSIFSLTTVAASSTTSVFTTERKWGGLSRNCNRFDLHLMVVSEAVCYISHHLIQVTRPGLSTCLFFSFFSFLVFFEDWNLMINKFHCRAIYWLESCAPVWLSQLL